MSHRLTRFATRCVRRYLVGPEQRWVFERPPENWTPPSLERTSLYLHVPFCRHFCPYCPYTKYPYRQSLLAPYTRAAIAEVDWWADVVGPAEITSIYIGGGTPTLALESVSEVLAHVRRRFRLTGELCIETNPADVHDGTADQLRAMDISMVSLGVESFSPQTLATIGRDYAPEVAQKALKRLVGGGFASVNVDIMFALPHQTTADVIADLDQAAAQGADQITTYPLFTFPYTAVGQYLRLKAVRMPPLRTRKEQYQAIGQWCDHHGYERVSVWGFKRHSGPRYSSVTRDGYIGIGPGAGSHLPSGFVLNTFDLATWIETATSGHPVIALYLPFANTMAGWWWLYWRFYDTHVPLQEIGTALGNEAVKATRWLKVFERAGLAIRHGNTVDLTEAGSFWLHLLQNYFALSYVNTLWTRARQEPWPLAIAI